MYKCIKSNQFEVAVNKLNLGPGEFRLGHELFDLEDTRVSIVELQGELFGRRVVLVIIPVLEHTADAMA